MIPLFLLVASLQQHSAIDDLNHVDPEVRREACNLLGARDVKQAVAPIIDLLRRESVEWVRKAAGEALERLTGVKGQGADYEKWKALWDAELKDRFPTTSLTADDVRALVEARATQLETKYRSRADETRAEIRILSIIVAVVGFVFVLVMIYFVGHVSSKLKEWKELVRQAENYIEEAQKVTKRTDRVLEELEAKKTDILEFVKNLKDEKEAEIERYADLLQQNTEHRMREEVMGLRQKAEKELEETLGQLRQQIELEVRRVATDQKDRIDKDLKAQHELFMKEVEAHTLFLQANFNHNHGKPEEALRLFKKLTALKPDHQVGWAKMGSVYRDLMRYDEALEAYQKAIDLDPNDPSCYYNLAATYSRVHKREKMLESLALAVKNDGEFKDEALNDPAFREYWNDPAFKDLAEA